jgi:hypothetical protein
LSPKQHQYPVVLIDECEQVFAHLVGATLKDRRREVFKLMEHYLRVAKVVVLLDADLAMVPRTPSLACSVRSFPILTPASAVPPSFCNQRQSEMSWL